MILFINVKLGLIDGSPYIRISFLFTAASSPSVNVKDMPNIRHMHYKLYWCVNIWNFECKSKWTMLLILYLIWEFTIWSRLIVVHLNVSLSYWTTANYSIVGMYSMRSLGAATPLQQLQLSCRSTIQKSSHPLFCLLWVSNKCCYTFHVWKKWILDILRNSLIECGSNSMDYKICVHNVCIEHVL